MVSGLNEFPTLFPFFTKEVLKPIEAPVEGIVNKTDAILITFDGRLLIPDLPFWKLMDRNLIFPLYHRSPSRCLSPIICMEHGNMEVIRKFKSETRISKSLPSPERLRARRQIKSQIQKSNLKEFYCLEHLNFRHSILFRASDLILMSHRPKP
jgi:hypothetical protein